MRAYEPARSAPDRAQCLARALSYSDQGLALVGHKIEQAWVLTARGYVLGKLADDGGDADDLFHFSMTHSARRKPGP